MELIVISEPGAATEEALTINQLFKAGLKRLHLRKPGWDNKQLTKLLMQIDKAFHHEIALHQHHEIAGDFDMKRLHYTEQHRMNTDLKKMSRQNKEGYVLSTSVHDLSTLARLTLFDYAFFGPVFNSISKQEYQSSLKDGFQIDKKCIKTKVIALGGVEETNLGKVKQMNFDGAAVLGAVWNDPTRAVVNLKSLMQKLTTW